MTVNLDGRASPIGRCTPVSSLAVNDSGVVWTRFDIESFRFSQAAALLVLQGWPMLKFFEGVRFHSPNFELRGTFVLLRGVLSEFTAPPLTLSRVVLARLHEIPENKTRDELLSVLLSNVL